MPAGRAHQGLLFPGMYGQQGRSVRQRRQDLRVLAWRGLFTLCALDGRGLLLQAQLPGPLGHLTLGRRERRHAGHGPGQRGLFGQRGLATQAFLRHQAEGERPSEHSIGSCEAVVQKVGAKACMTACMSCRSAQICSTVVASERVLRVVRHPHNLWSGCACRRQLSCLYGTSMSTQSGLP